MKREQWTVEYRNWIGASKYGLIFTRARKGSGKWRDALSLPEYVTEYLGLTKARSHWCMAPVRNTNDFGPHITFAARKANRIHIDMPVPDRRKPVKTYSPLTVGRLFYADGPGEVYRQTYKYTDCGPSVGFHIHSLAEGPRWVYCDSLRQLGSWKEMAERGERIDWLSVGSIVEGVDYDCETIEVQCEPLTTLRKRFSNAIADVNREANEIWDMTHGCPDCGDEVGGYRPINPGCKACNGQGTIL